MAEAQSVAEALSFVWSRFTGQVLVRGDEGYESARRVWNGMINKRPAAIVRCGSEPMCHLDRGGTSFRAADRRSRWWPQCRRAGDE